MHSGLSNNGTVALSTSAGVALGALLPFARIACTASRKRARRGAGGRDAGCDQLIHEAAMEIQALRIGLGWRVPGGNDARPGKREAVRGLPEAPHELHVALVAVVVMAHDDCDRCTPCRPRRRPRNWPAIDEDARSSSSHARFIDGGDA